MIDCFFREDFAYDEDGQKHLEPPESRDYLAVLADRLAGLARFHPRRDRGGLPPLRRGARDQGRPDRPPRPHGRQRQDQGGGPVRDDGGPRPRSASSPA
ncbi:MAG: hypothetical protein M0C28_01105 [Candidatus Moduliflexus flocculans]|nr:hypothetical protein [Candidatus Moduliflexus flocculans]